MDNPALRENAAVAAPNTVVPGRQAFLSAPLPAGLRISGTTTVSLRVKVDRPNTELTARLVDYGPATRINYLGQGEGVRNLATESCWGESTPADDACYLDTAKTTVTSDHAIMTRGWLDAAHRDSLTSQKPLQPGRWYTVTWELNAHDALLPRGRVLGLVLTVSDTQYTIPSSTGATVQVDLSRSRLNLPVALSPGRAAFTETPVAPRVSAAPVPLAVEDDRRIPLR